MARRITAAVVVLLAVGAGIAYATIPDAGGVIHGCYMKDGTLRVIDSDAGQSCRNNETALNWNQTGPQGHPGEPATRIWAVVDGFGNLVRGSNALSSQCISGCGTTTSTVDVTFAPTIDVSQCAAVATLRELLGNIKALPSGQSVPDHSVRVSVQETLSSGAHSFSLALFC
jgi:hypothetical protein